jgi:hypothetical protein
MNTGDPLCFRLRGDGDGDFPFVTFITPNSTEFLAEPLSPRDRYRNERWLDRYERRYGHRPRRGEVGSLWGVRVAESA